MVTIRAADALEADTLTRLALRSKAHWGYSQAFMDTCRHELTITPQMIETSPVMVLETIQGIQGFYSLQRIDETSAEICHLFIAPEAIGSGYGKQLWQHALQQARAAGCRRVQVESDPNAEDFYLRMGMRRCGEHHSSLFPGRILPLLELDL